MDNPDRWYKHVNALQMALNSTFQRSVGMSPFEVLIGTKMRFREDLNIAQLLEEEAVQIYDDQRDDLRRIAKKNILKIQEENKKGHNKMCTEANVYKEGDLVAIKRTQFGPGLKINKKYLGPYKITQIKGNDRYEVIKIDDDEEGPRITTSAADYMKPYGGVPSGTEGFKGWPNVE